MNIENKIESILLYKNEPTKISELALLTDSTKDEILEKISILKEFYKNRGLVIISDNETVSFGTHPDNSDLIEKIKKEEISKEIGKAGLETLTIILYKGPLSRKEIDYIRGVNSGHIIRNLLIRGLIEKDDSNQINKSFTYKPTLELLKFLGLTKREELPEFSVALDKLDQFVKDSEDKQDN